MPKSVVKLEKTQNYARVCEVFRLFLFFLLPLVSVANLVHAGIRPLGEGHYGSASKRLNRANDHAQSGLAHSRGDILCLSVQRVEVGPPVPEHRVAYGQELPRRGHLGRAPPPPLRHPVVELGHRRVVSEMGVNGLNQRPPEPPGTFPGDPAVPCNPSAALGAGHQTGVAGQLVA